MLRRALLYFVVGAIAAGGLEDDSWSFDRPATVHELNHAEDGDSPGLEPGVVPGLPAPKPLAVRVLA